MRGFLIGLVRLIHLALRLKLRALFLERHGKLGPLCDPRLGIETCHLRENCASASRPGRCALANKLLHALPCAFGVCWILEWIHFSTWRNRRRRRTLRHCTRSFECKCPQTVAAPAAPAARSNSRLVGWILLVAVAGRTVFALGSCVFRSSSAFFILHLPLQDTPIAWIRRVLSMLSGNPKPRCNPIASFRQEVRVRPAVRLSGCHDPSRRRPEYSVFSLF